MNSSQARLIQEPPTERISMHAFCLASPQPHISFVRLPFSFSLPLLSRLMEMAFVLVNLYILFFWLLLDQRSAPSFLLCPGSCILTSTYVESTFQGRQEGACSCFSFHIEFAFHVVLPFLWSEDQFSLSFAAFIPACSLPHRPCILHACPSISPSLMAEGEPCSRLDRRGALPELEQACQN